MNTTSDDTATLLRAKLTAAFEPLKLELRDDSAQHAGHAGAKEGAHFAVLIVSAKFSGRRAIERHRMVYMAAADLLTTRIHALQISAFSPEETGVTR